MAKKISKRDFHSKTSPAKVAAELWTHDAELAEFTRAAPNPATTANTKRFASTKIAIYLDALVGQSAYAIRQLCPNFTFDGASKIHVATTTPTAAMVDFPGEANPGLSVGSGNLEKPRPPTCVKVARCVYCI